MTTTIVETGIARKITVVKHSRHTANLAVRDTDLDDAVYAHLDKEQSEKVGLALLGENATVITDLPEAEVVYNGYVGASGYSRALSTRPEEVLENAKALLAMHKFLVEKQAKEAEVEAQRIKEAELAAEAEKRDKRRDELANELWGYGAFYRNRTSYAQKAIDRIVELETAQA